MKKEVIIENRKVLEVNPDGTIAKLYKEMTIGRTTYQVTSVFLGEIELGSALEELAAKKVLSEMGIY